MTRVVAYALVAIFGLLGYWALGFEDTVRHDLAAICFMACGMIYSTYRQAVREKGM